LFCEGDLAVIKNARDLGGEVEVIRITVGHCPFLSMPQETAKWVIAVAGEKV
jgi:hypothetical protein